MMSMIIAKYSIVALFAVSGSPLFGESYLQQAPPEKTNPAFVEQLPETSVVPAPQLPTEHRKPPHRPRAAPSVRPQTALANSIFPSVGNGVTERAAPAPMDNSLPTVGQGTVGH